MSDGRGLTEVELKSVVDDPALCRARVERAGGRLVFEGRMEDRRYDTAARLLDADDHVLRLRIYRDASGERGMLDWKSPTRRENGYKVRTELSTTVGDPSALHVMLEALGYEISREIDRDIAQYEIDGATVRFERYPRMDVLVEVEGEPAAIERAITTLALARDGFTTDRLRDFVRRFEMRTGERAAICDRELRGDYRYAVDDA